MKPLIQLKRATPICLIVVLITCLGSLQNTQAVVPPPDGGYPRFTTAEGDHALQALTLGLGNTGIGTFSLFRVTTGSFNTGVGAGALDLNIADLNTAVGAAALLLNIAGTLNTAVGVGAIAHNGIGIDNDAVGAFALFNNLDGHENNAFGAEALRENIHGFQNTALGDDSLMNNDSSGNGTANDNTAVGSEALEGNIDGSANTAVGAGAGAGSGGITTGTGNTVVGADAGQSIGAGGENIYIGHSVDPGISESGTIRIGDSSLPTLGATSTCFIAGISGQSVGPMSAPVIINAGGQLGTLPSSARFKKDIDPMGKTSEAIYSLRPVTFHYKSDETNTPQWGLIAEDVAKVDPALILKDKEGKPQTVRYEQINAMLLNEFLKEHQKVQGLEAIVAQQQKSFGSKVAQQQKQIEALTAGLQKVSAQFEVSKPSAQTVQNNR